MPDPRPMTEKQRNREAVQRYKARNRDKIRANDRESRRARTRSLPAEVRHAKGLWRIHRITPADKLAMLDAQDGKCYLCGDELAYAKAFIDHDHACCPQGRSCAYCRRGLACDSCNTLIGYARDDPARLIRIAANLAAVLPGVAERMASKPLQLPLDLATVNE